MNKFLEIDDDLYHFVSLSSDSPIGMCGNFVRICGDSWDKVTCPECLKHKPMPKRIQRESTRGWKMPKNTIYVGRPSKWGNQFQCLSRYESVKRFEESLNDWINNIYGYGENHSYEEFIAPLRGKNLACWCPLDQPCHADVLLKLANAEVRDEQN